jgi:predicted AAA+ superfamily ATPase
MIPRHAREQVLLALRRFPAVALIGPRQVGKTTLAIGVDENAVYLDLESPAAHARLADPEAYLRSQAGRLVILDEVQVRPDLFPILRGILDERRRAGATTGQFLLTGSAAPDLQRQASETLAGRLAYVPLASLLPGEVSATELERLWVRGGFPDAFLAGDEPAAWAWRGQFIASYLDRDLPRFGLKLPAVQLHRLWTMLAHSHGQTLNAERLATGLGLASATIRRYVDCLTDLFLVRQLPGHHSNLGKRMVKAPKLYLRDSGILHHLVGAPDLDALLGHPVCGPSWEGFVIESLLGHLGEGWNAGFYRTQAGAEIDLVVTGPQAQVFAVEIKRTTAPVLSRGFLSGCEDLQPHRRMVIVPSGESFPLGHDTRAISLTTACAEILRGGW